MPGGWGRPSVPDTAALTRTGPEPEPEPEPPPLPLTLTRCAGHCDDTELKCYCGGGKFPRRAMFQCEFKGVGRSMPWKVTPTPNPYP